MKKTPDKTWLEFRRCRCGWVGTTHQLALLVRRDKVVSKICPQCSSTEINQNALLANAMSSELVH